MSPPPLNALCIIGPPHVDGLRDLLVPSLAAAAGARPLTLSVLNYLEPVPLLETTQVGAVTVRDVSAQRSAGHLGFGEAVNAAVAIVRPEPYFLLLNPDTLPMEGFVDALVARFDAASRAARSKGMGPGIVEARQWPSEHPKGYDADTGETPWASGACCLISSAAFEAVGGFDPIYFLYNEDVDLSWRIWQAGWTVLYEPKALCAHNTGLHSYRIDRFYTEHLLSCRNFLVIAWKFFGAAGERRALALLRDTGFPETFKRQVRTAYEAMKPTVRPVSTGRRRHPALRITGFNLFH